MEYMNGIENNSSGGAFKGFTIAIMLILVAAVGYLGWDHYQQKKTESVNYVDAAEYAKVPTVEEAVEEFNATVAEDLRYSRYLQLSPDVMRAIFVRIGTEPSVTDVMNEYDANKEYYLSIQASNQIPDIDMSGPDVNRIKKMEVAVELDTTPPINENLKKVSPRNQ